MKRIAVVTAGALLLASASTGLAAGKIKKREDKQQHQIEQGVKKGKITPKEENRLENQQDTIERERQEAWQDGKMSKRERKDIKHDQKRLHQDIQNKKENERKMHQ